MSLIVLLLLALLSTPAYALVTSVASGPWSAPSTWDARRLPDTEEFVVIAAGTTVTYDLPISPAYAQVQVLGDLVFSQNGSTLMNVGLLLVQGGHLTIGTEATPLPAIVTATVRLVYLPTITYTHTHGQPALAPALHTHGGIVDLHGAPTQATWTRLVANAQAGATILTVADDVSDWQVGDHIIVTGTNRLWAKGQTAATRTYLVGACDIRSQDIVNCLDTAQFQVEEATVAAVQGKTLTLTSPLQYTHLGTAPRQAAVGRLTRNILITSADTVDRRGHVMLAHGVVVADTNPLPTTPYPLVTAHISQVEFAHLGRPAPGVYPVHFHRLLNAGKDSYVRGSAIHHTQNLCVRVHTTNFLTVADNVCYHALGHGYVTEDGSEMYNVFHHNLASRTMHAIKTNPNDTTDINEGSGFWINNPRNALTANHASDTDAWGYQVDPVLVAGNPPKGKVVAMVAADGAALPAAPVTSLSMGPFEGNSSQGNFFGGLEAINLDSLEWSTVKNFTAIDPRMAGLAPFATRFRVEQSTFLGGCRTWPGDYICQDNNAYSPGNFTGIALQARPEHRFVDSEAGEFHFGYQFPGTLVFERTHAKALRFTSEGITRLVVIAGTPRPEKLSLDRNVPSIAAHGQDEVYVFDADGPGKHIKLMQMTSMPADTLAYALSTRWPTPSAKPRYQYQEASFTGPTGIGPALHLPFFLNTGSRQANTIPAKDILDAQGRVWAMDDNYANLTEGYTLPRYGCVNMPGTLQGVVPLRIGQDYSSIYGTTLHTYRPKATCRFDVPNGTYHVDLHFIENNFPDFPSAAKRGPGLRVFHVDVASVRMLTSLDIYQVAGGNYKPLVRSTTATVTAGHLDVDIWFPGTIAGIAVCRLDQVVNNQCVSQ